MNQYFKHSNNWSKNDVGTPCPKCKTLLVYIQVDITKMSKKRLRKRAKRLFNYSAYLRCNCCRTNYFINSARVYNDLDYEDKVLQEQLAMIGYND